MVKDTLSQKSALIYLRDADAALSAAKSNRCAFSIENFHDITEVQKILGEIIGDISNEIDKNHV